LTCESRFGYIALNLPLRQRTPPEEAAPRDRRDADATPPPPGDGRMIQAVVGIFVFAVVLCAWIVFDPFASEPDGDLAGLAPDAAEVTRGLALDATLPAARPATQADVARQVARLDGIVEDILTGLGFAPVAEPEQLRSLTDGALAGIRAATGTAGAAPTSALAEIVLAGLQAGQEDAAIDALVQAAAPDVPQALRATDGRIDTGTVLRAVVARARTRVAAADAARVARADYVVASGDSLAGIAQAHFGDLTAIAAILDANGAVLNGPDGLRTGQALILPAR